MGERRALIEGLSEVEKIDPDAAEAFINNEKPRKPRTAATKPAVEETPTSPPLPPSVLAAAQVNTRSSASPLTGIGRVPVGARVRTELAADLKRASLERQLLGIEPNSVQDILEDALELWLLKHGHRR